MSKVVFEISMSLDGFITGVNRTTEEPLGKDGERLHDWALGADERGRALCEASCASAGAMISGRRNYDDSLPWWGANGPTGQHRVPVFVVTHEAPRQSPEGGVYTFVTDGIESALRKARAAANGKIVYVMGGANLGQQYIAAGLVDEVYVHVVPVLFGSGLRMFERLGDEHLWLEAPEVIPTLAATHLRFRVKRPS